MVDADDEQPLPRALVVDPEGWVRPATHTLSRHQDMLGPIERLGSQALHEQDDSLRQPIRRRRIVHVEMVERSHHVGQRMWGGGTASCVE